MYSQTTILVGLFDMGRPRNTIPTLRIHKASGLAYIAWEGDTVYLGPAGSVESVEAYRSALQTIAATGSARPAEKKALSVRVLAERYEASLVQSYPADSREPDAIKRATRDLVAACGGTDAAAFGPQRLIELRDSWIARGLAAKTINTYQSYVLNCYRWGVMTGLVDARAWESLRAVPRLRPGRSQAKPPRTVTPVAWEHVEAVLGHVRPQVRDMILLQWHTGMRTGEILSMTWSQIEDGVYRPRRHKNSWRGRRRDVILGPEAQRILRDYAGLCGDADSLLFKGYTASSYGKAIRRACVAAKIPHWHPHQIRHAMATRVRDKWGLEVAQAVLGHANAATTEIYAETKVEKARKAIDEIG